MRRKDRHRDRMKSKVGIATRAEDATPVVSFNRDQVDPQWPVRADNAVRALFLLGPQSHEDCLHMTSVRPEVASVNCAVTVAAYGDTSWRVRPFGRGLPGASRRLNSTDTWKFVPACAVAAVVCGIGLSGLTDSRSSVRVPAQDQVQGQHGVLTEPLNQTTRMIDFFPESEGLRAD